MKQAARGHEIAMKRMPPDNRFVSSSPRHHYPEDHAMQTFPIRRPAARHALLALMFALAAGTAAAADAAKGIEQALVAAQQDKRGID